MSHKISKHLEELAFNRDDMLWMWVCARAWIHVNTNRPVDLNWHFVSISIMENPVLLDFYIFQNSFPIETFRRNVLNIVLHGIQFNEFSVATCAHTWKWHSQNRNISKTWFKLKNATHLMHFWFHWDWFI